MDSVKGHGDLEVIRSIRFIPPNDRIIRIRELLQHDDPEVRYRAILEIAEIPPEKASSILKDVIVSEKNPRNLTTAARVVLDLLGPDGLDLIKDLLQSSEDPRLLADMIEAISIAGDQPQVRTLIMRCLSHNNHRVRGTAVLGLLRIANDKESLGDALDVLLNMVFHPDALFRASAAVGMGAMGLPIFIPPLSHLADDQDVNVTRNALNSLGNIRTPAALAAISTRSASGGWRGEIAASIWGFTSRESFEHMVGVLSYLNMADRKSLGVRFQNLGNSDFFALLEKILNLENQEIRERLTRSLKSFDKDKIEMIANCIKPLDSENTIVDIEPLIGELGASDFVVLSPQAELVPILCGRANEKYEQFIDDAVMNLYREGALLEKAKNFGLFKNTSDEATSFDKFEKKIQVSLHLIALGVENPPQILDAFDKAMSSDKFICSVSQEFLEEKLGRLKASLILPLLMGRRLLSEIAQITEKHFGIKFSDGEKEAVSALMKEKGYFL
ncbi:HEAT repeat domain-containing protein [bacterium]|nr:HEAT repeat domain-containing protein [bacterium]